MLMPQKKTQKAIFWVLTILIGVGLLGSSIVWTLPDDPMPSTPPTVEVQGDAAEDAGTGLESLEAKVKADAKNTAAWLQLGQSYRSAGVLDKAVEAYESVLKVDEQNQNARMSLAEIYMDQGRYDEALAQLDQLLAVNPQHQAALWTAVGVLAEGKQDYQGAISRLQDYIALVGDSPEAEQAQQMITFLRQSAEQQAAGDLPAEKNKE